jgi:hypothetical protein
MDARDGLPEPTKSTGRERWRQEERTNRILASRRAPLQETSRLAATTILEITLHPGTLARAKERNSEICHDFWLPSALFCDVPPAHSVGVRKDTPPARPSGEYLFTRSKRGRPKTGLHPLWCRQRGASPAGINLKVSSWPAKRYSTVPHRGNLARTSGCW